MSANHVDSRGAHAADQVETGLPGPLELDLIRRIRLALNQRRLWTFLPAEVQKAFADWRRRGLTRYIRSYSPLLLLLVYLLAGGGTLQLWEHLGKQDARWWFFGTLAITGGMTIALIMAQTAFIQRHYSMFAMTLSVLVLTKFMAWPQLMENAAAVLAESLFCMVSIAIVVLALRLRFRESLPVCLTGALLGQSLAFMASPHPENWPVFLLPFTSMMGFCLFLSWIMEDEERVGFLQAILIEHVTREREALIRELDDMAFRDMLSGLANRREFDRHLQTEWERMRREHKPLSALYVDIDYFKRFNDHYGHAGGDDCLTAVGQVLRNSLLRPADLAARYGGEEFVLLLPDTDPAGALDVANRVLMNVRAMRYPHEASPVSAYVSVSVGVATLQPGPLNAPEQLLALADQALYEAKQQGRDRLCAAPLLKTPVVVPRKDR